MTFPTADQIAVAIVGSCRLTCEDPIALVQGARGHKARARYIALAALLEVFPDAPKAGLARCLSFRTPSSAVSNLKHQTRKLHWWCEDAVDEVVGALVADDLEGAVAPVATSRAPAGIRAPRFHSDQQLVIHRMWKRGADPHAIASSIGAEAHEIDAYARAYPDRCRPRQGA